MEDVPSQSPGSMVSVDFFTVPPSPFRCFTSSCPLHQRRILLHFNIVEGPSAGWTAQQLREAFPFTSPPKYLLRDRDGIYGLEFQRRAEALGWRSPDRPSLAVAVPVRRTVDWFGSARLSGSRHRAQPGSLAPFAQPISPITTGAGPTGLGQGCPRTSTGAASGARNDRALPQVGGLHHRYERLAA